MVKYVVPVLYLVSMTEEIVRMIVRSVRLKKRRVAVMLSFLLLLLLFRFNGLVFP